MNEDRILVLTTREKNWWWSLQEVIPAIERVWIAIGRSRRRNVRLLCVPLAPEIERSLHLSAPLLKYIVITVVTPGTTKVALFLRLQMSVAVPMIIYIFGDATEGLHAFEGIADVLTEMDMFVVSCEAEAVAFRSCFPRARIIVIPFPLLNQFKLNGEERDTKLKPARLAYVGRISEQKNLHTLLFALWILRIWYDPLPGITLDVYGGVDDLGSPNMGLKFPNYGTYLRGLAELLEVDHMLTWHGIKPRDWLFDNVHLKHHILVSPTLHSDENFGTSVLASLVNGHQVVTTAWGGHFGFQELFSQQLTIVPVRQSTMGPVVDPVLLASAMLRVINRMSSIFVDNVTLDRARAEFSDSAVAARTLEMLIPPGGRSVPLEKSLTQRYIDERRALFGGSRKIFANYADPVAQIFFEAYGMKEPLLFQEQSSYVLPPWTSCSDHILHIVDPHRGRQSFRLDSEVSGQLNVTICPSIDTCSLPESLVKTLVNQGYAFSLPRSNVTVGKESPQTRIGLTDEVAPDA